MIRVLLHCLCLLVLATTALAQRLNDGDRLWFAMTIEPDYVLSRGTYVGGEIVMSIELMSPDSLQRLRLNLPDIEGARVDTLVRPHMRQLSSLGAMGYSDITGYSFEARLVIVPERSGRIIIPPITVTGIAQPGEGSGIEFRKTFPKHVITVFPASPQFGGDHWVVSPKVVIEEFWSPDIASIKNGDIVRRHIILSVTGVTADDLPELTLGANDGFHVLSTGVSAETEKTDDGFIARLEQSWDIYVETEDVIHIDGFRFPYWNPALARTEMVSLPRKRVEPLPEDALVLREHLRNEVLARHRAKRLGLVALMSLPAVLLLLFLALVFWQARPTRADLSLWRAARQGGAPLGFYAAFLSWGRKSFGTQTIAGQEQISLLGTQAVEQVDRLHASIFASHGSRVKTARVARTLIGASRRMTMVRWVSALRSNLATFLFLR